MQRPGSICAPAIRSIRSQFHGSAAPHRPAAYTVSSLKKYLECPFRFFTDRVLELKEDPEDEATLTPRELGIFVHKVFQVFFEEWNRRPIRNCARQPSCGTQVFRESLNRCSWTPR